MAPAEEVHGGLNSCHLGHTPLPGPLPVYCSPRAHGQAGGTAIARAAMFSGHSPIGSAHTCHRHTFPCLSWDPPTRLQEALWGPIQGLVGAPELLAHECPCMFGACFCQGVSGSAVAASIVPFPRLTPRVGNEASLIDSLPQPPRGFQAPNVRIVLLSLRAKKPLLQTFTGSVPPSSPTHPHDQPHRLCFNK